VETTSEAGERALRGALARAEKEKEKAAAAAVGRIGRIVPGAKKDRDTCCSRDSECTIGRNRQSEGVGRVAKAKDELLKRFSAGWNDKGDLHEKKEKRSYNPGWLNIIVLPTRPQPFYFILMYCVCVHF
jgi:hypothetical protein